MKGLLASSIAGSGLALAVAFTLGGAYPLALASLLPPSLWLLSLWRGWQLGALAFVLLLLLAGLGLIGFAPAPLVLLGAVIALLAWDLEGFLGRLARAGNVRGKAALQRSHLRRLLGAAGLGLLLAGLSLLIRLELNLVWALLLVAFVMLGLARGLPSKA